MELRPCRTNHPHPAPLPPAGEGEMPDMTNPRPLGYGALVLFLASVPFANWLIQHVGTVCVPEGPCLVPVAPGLLAPSGVLAAGAALVLRDVVQRCLGA